MVDSRHGGVLTDTAIAPVPFGYSSSATSGNSVPFQYDIKLQDSSEVCIKTKQPKNKHQQQNNFRLARHFRARIAELINNNALGEITTTSSISFTPKI